jgi:hypothetical protein
MFGERMDQSFITANTSGECHARSRHAFFVTSPLDLLIGRAKS